MLAKALHRKLLITQGAMRNIHPLGAKRTKKEWFYEGDSLLIAGVERTSGLERTNSLSVGYMAIKSFLFPSFRQGARGFFLVNCW